MLGATHMRGWTAVPALRGRALRNRALRDPVLRSLVLASVLGALGACSPETINGTPAPVDGQGGGKLDGSLDDQWSFDFGSLDSGCQTGPFGTGCEDAILEDVPPLPGTFGAPCADSTECDSGVCVESADGKICSQACTESCPTGFKCSEQQTTGGDTTFVCVPRFKHLCDPCLDNLGCNGKGESGNVCIKFKDTGSFCGAACDPLSPQCPSAYECQAVTDPVTGFASNQCVRQAGLGACECSTTAKLLGLKTTCANKNEIGTCSGERICTAEGLSTCTAKAPDYEECNGLDDDCNGKTDDFEDGIAASCKSKPNEFGQCKGKLIACQDGEPICDAPAAKPEACNGLDDNCNGDTDEGLCEDGDPCTKGLCNTDGSCQQVQIAGMACDDGSLCTQTDKCLSGKCVGGNMLACDDQDPCTTDACDPFTGCTHTPASDAICTDDGNSCTQDVCQAGKCVHPNVNDGSACADDGQACTADVCMNGGCQHQPAEGLKCQDDGKPCTDDVCQAGACAHVNGTGACEDGNFCTDNDVCSGGLCKPGKLNQCNDGNPCTDDSCNPATGCVHKPGSGTPCTAPSGDCPQGVCSAGTCLSKPNVTCQTKVKLDLCGSVPVAGVCTASGKCTPLSSPNSVSCTIPCNGICFKCFTFQVCLPLQ